MEPVLFFARPPMLNDLCAVTVIVHRKNLKPPLSLTTVQPHVIKCREIIFTEPDVIASPSYDVESCFNLVLQQSLFKTGKIQQRLKNHGLEVSKVHKVHPTLYQACLRYTAIARMAPSWNRLGDWFIQGRDFLVHDGYANGIKMNLYANREEIFISLIGSTVKSIPLQVEDLNLSQNEMMEIVKSTEGQIRHVEVEVSDCWCHVLPSMKRGRICTLSLTIPRESPFVTYKDLKRHWKNTYGYRLPETDEDILYCQVSFWTSGGGRLFTYPSICLRAGPVQIIPRVDPKLILTAFLQDMHSKLSSVCGTILRFQPKIRYAELSLHSASEDVEQINLSRKPLKKPEGPLRSIKSLTHLYCNSQTEKSTLKQQLQTGSFQNEMRQKSSNGCLSSSNSVTESTSILSQDKVHLDTNELSKPNVKHNVHNELGNVLSQKACTQETSGIRDNVQDTSMTSNGASSVSNSSSENISVVSEYNMSNTQSVDSKLTTSQVTKFVPLFRAKQKNPFQAKKSSETPRINGLKSGTVVPVFKAKSHPSAKESFAQVAGRTTENGTKLQQPAQSSATVPLFSYCMKSNDINPYSIANPSLQKAFPNQVTPQQSVIKPFGEPLCFPSTLALSSFANKGRNSSIGGPDTTKRKLNKEENQAPKKQRSKQQIQSLDVESLARCNQLNKVNSTTLTSWLKEHGVTVKSKDKKSDLVDKVNTLLQITMPEL